MEYHYEFNFNVYGKQAQQLVGAVIDQVSHINKSEIIFFGIHRQDDDRVYGVVNGFCYRDEACRERVCKMIRAVLRDAIGKNWKDPKCLDWDINLFGAVDRHTVREVRCLLGIVKGEPEQKLIREFGKKAFLKVKGTPADPFVTARRKMFREKREKLQEEAAKKLEKLQQTATSQYIRKCFRDELKMTVNELIAKAIVLGREMGKEDDVELGRSCADEQVR